jgi:hypothetical protein
VAKTTKDLLEDFQHRNANGSKCKIGEKEVPCCLTAREEKCNQTWFQDRFLVAMTRLFKFFKERRATRLSSFSRKGERRGFQVFQGMEGDEALKFFKGWRAKRLSSFSRKGGRRGSQVFQGKESDEALKFFKERRATRLSSFSTIAPKVVKLGWVESASQRAVTGKVLQPERSCIGADVSVYAGLNMSTCHGHDDGHRPLIIGLV